MRKFVAFVEHLFEALTRYSPFEQQGVVLLVSVAAGALLWVTLRPAAAPDAAFLARADRLDDSTRAAWYAGRRPPQGLQRPGRGAAQAAHPAVPVELNTADSARLTAVRGIGPVIARNIVEYRRRLGGFYALEQLREVRGVTDENFEALAAQLFIAGAVIQKIDINFASAAAIRQHPYFTGSMTGRILRAREAKGGWNNLKELTDNDILLPREAEKVAPYVVFGPRRDTEGTLP